VTLRAFGSWLALCLLLAVACCGKQQPDKPLSPASAGRTSPLEKRAGGGLHDVPRVTLVAITDWQAVLKPCGCTVDLQKGGIERIARAVAELRSADDSVLVVHAGSLLADEEPVSSARAPQLALRMQAFAKALGDVGVAAVALSQQDLDLGGETARNLLAQAPWPVLSLTPRAQVPKAQRSVLQKTASGVQVGLLGVDAADPEVSRQQAVATEVQALRAKGAQVVVVLSNLGMRASRKLARAVPGIDVLVVGHLDHKIEPLADLEREGDTLLVHATRQGAWFAALTLVPRPGGGGWTEASEFVPGVAADLEARMATLGKQIDGWRKDTTVATQRALPFYEAQLADLRARLTKARSAAGRPLPAGKLVAYRAVGLPWSAPVDAGVQAIVQRYDAAVAELNQKTAGTVPEVAPGQAGYVGQAVCVACHTKTADFVAHDLHQKAWATLEKAGKTNDLDCVPCHVTGFGKPGGAALGKLAHLQNVQCEACHGPGSLHIAAPADKGKVTRVPTEATCLGCHTPEHAPRFAFELYRKRLLVPGHGLPPAAP